MKRIDTSAKIAGTVSSSVINPAMDHLFCNPLKRVNTEEF